MNARGGAIEPPTLSFVVPFWNEIDGAGACVERLLDAARGIERDGAFREVRLVLVDDGSSDGTGAVLEHFEQRSEVTLVRNAENRGKGGALHAGFGAVETDWAFQTDADLPVLPESAVVAHRLAVATGAGVVSCIRRNRQVEGWKRAVMTRGYNRCVRAATGLRLRDVNAPKLIAGELLPHVGPTMSGVICDAEVLARAQRAGARLDQIEVEAFPRQFGRSSYMNPRTVVQTFWDLVRFGPGLRV